MFLKTSMPGGTGCNPVLLQATGGHWEHAVCDEERASPWRNHTDRLSTEKVNFRHQMMPVKARQINA